MRSFEVHPETGRDADTFRAVIAPPRREQEDEDRTPSKWPFAVSVLIGALVGLVVVAKTYAEDHPALPVAARTTVAVVAPAVAPPAETKVLDANPVVGTAASASAKAPAMITPEPPKRAKKRTKR